MTVSELIELLKTQDPGVMVRVWIKKGDSADVEGIRPDRYWAGHRDQDEPCVLVFGSHDSECDN